MNLKTCITGLLIAIGTACIQASAAETDTRHANPCDGANYALYTAERRPSSPCPATSQGKTGHLP